MIAKTPAKVQYIAKVYHSCEYRNHCHRGPSKVAHIYNREPAVSEGWYERADQSDGCEYEEDLVRVTGNRWLTFFIAKDVHAWDEQGSRSEVHSNDYSDSPDKIKPATDPACQSPPFRGRKHEGLVIDAYVNK